MTDISTRNKCLFTFSAIADFAQDGDIANEIIEIGFKLDGANTGINRTIQVDDAPIGGVEIPFSLAFPLTIATGSHNMSLYINNIDGNFLDNCTISVQIL